MRSTQLYEVWWSKGDGTRRGPRFTSLDAAISFVNSQKDAASFAIRTPQGSWYRAPDSGRAILERDPRR